MALVGGDAPALFGFANQLRQRREAIIAATNALRALVEQANWVGPDREVFIAEWQNAHAPRLHSICGELATAAIRISNHAHMQQEASS